MGLLEGEWLGSPFPTRPWAEGCHHVPKAWNAAILSRASTQSRAEGPCLNRLLRGKLLFLCQSWAPLPIGPGWMFTSEAPRTKKKKKNTNHTGHPRLSQGLGTRLRGTLQETINRAQRQAQVP